MKLFFKKHPELLCLFALVLIINSVLICLLLNDRKELLSSKTEMFELKIMAEKIAESGIATNRINLERSVQQEELVAKAYLKQIEKRKSDYKYLENPAEDFNNPPNAKLNMQSLLDGMKKNLLSGIDETSDKLSFAKFYNQAIMQMPLKDIPLVFEVFNGFAVIAENCAKAGITSIDSVKRPSGLRFYRDKDLGTKAYTYIIEVSGSGIAVKSLLNKLCNDNKYFYEIRSAKLRAVNQIKYTNDDMRPIIERPSIASEGGEQPILNETTAPFKMAVNKLELVIDWVQFTE